VNKLPFKARKAVFEKLDKIVDIASLSKEEREKYDESIKVYRDHLATLAYAEQKGLQKGRLEGKREEAIAIARNLKAKGLSVDLIAETTGLSAEEIEKL
jgi:predicted transposase/invertase (TIGR01784 family)